MVGLSGSARIVRRVQNGFESLAPKKKERKKTPPGGPNHIQTYMSNRPLFPTNKKKFQKSFLDLYGNSCAGKGFFFFIFCVKDSKPFCIR